MSYMSSSLIRYHLEFSRLLDELTVSHTQTYTEYVIDALSQNTQVIFWAVIMTIRFQQNSSFSYILF